MARRRYGFDEKRNQRFIRQGRGKGTLENYKPWVTVADVPSLGRVHRVFCPKTGRTHHMLSDNEYYAFLYLWWDDDVIDIREQFPLLDRRETLEIAACCGVRHPVDPVSGALWVMTTDFLTTIRTTLGTEMVAYAVKQSEKLRHVRTLEKLEIERRYWERRQVRWSILTDQHVKNTYTRNLAWILSARNNNSEESACTDIDIDVQCVLAEEQLTQPYTPIRLVCLMADKRLNRKAGTALAVLRRLLGLKRIKVDLWVRSIQDLEIKEFNLFGGK